MQLVEETTFRYTVTTGKSIEEAIQALGQALQERKFAILWDLDVRAKLEEKGVPGGPEFHVLEVCSAPRAKEALDTDLRVGYFLPCKVVVYRQGGATHIGLLKPTALMQFFSDEKLHGFAREVEDTLRAALEACR